MLGGYSADAPFTVESRMADEPYVNALSVSPGGNTDETESQVESFMLARQSRRGRYPAHEEQHLRCDEAPSQARSRCSWAVSRRFRCSSAASAS
ncbi:MAG: hypothetical protein R2881_06805 [Eubacteriales bacterium]